MKLTEQLDQRRESRAYKPTIKNRSPFLLCICPTVPGIIRKGRRHWQNSLSSLGTKGWLTPRPAPTTASKIARRKWGYLTRLA